MNSALSEYRAAKIALNFGPAQVTLALDNFSRSRGEYPVPTASIPHPRTVAHWAALGIYTTTDGQKVKQVGDLSKTGHPTWARRFGIGCPVSQ